MLNDIAGQVASNELIAHVTAPKRFIKDDKGEIIGAEIED